MGRSLGTRLSYNSFTWNGPGFGLPYVQGCPDTATTESSQQADEPSGTAADHFTMEVKLLNSQNKREFRLFTLRDVSPELINSPDKLKNELVQQCGLLTDNSIMFKKSEVRH